MDDLLGVVELHHVAGVGRRARDEGRDDEHVRIPLEREAREVAGPQRAVLRLAASELPEAGLVPLAVYRRAGTAERRLRRHHLYRVPIAIVDAEVVATGEVAQPRMEAVGVVAPRERS